MGFLKTLPLIDVFWIALLCCPTVPDFAEPEPDLREGQWGTPNCGGWMLKVIHDDWRYKLSRLNRPHPCRLRVIREWWEKLPGFSVWRLHEPGSNGLSLAHPWSLVIYFYDILGTNGFNSNVASLTIRTFFLKLFEENHTFAISSGNQCNFTVCFWTGPQSFRFIVDFGPLVVGHGQRLPERSCGRDAWFLEWADEMGSHRNQAWRGWHWQRLDFWYFCMSHMMAFR